MAPLKKTKAIRGVPSSISKRNKDDGNMTLKDVYSLEQLPWKNISFPEQLEDAAGFLGLEELSDVGVTRDRASDSLKYYFTSVKGSNGSKKRKISEDRDRPTAPFKTENKNDDDWHGFPESPNTAQITFRNKPSKFLRQRSPEFFSQVRKSRKQIAGSATRDGGFELLRDLKEEYVDVSEWQALGLSEETMTALARIKFTHPTPIQKAAIPEILRGHDVIGKASTGSGKTLAFGIPIYESVVRYQNTQKGAKQADFENQIKAPTALILSPTRELAHQLLDHIGDLCGTVDGPVIAAVTGGISMHKQQRVLGKADIIIATPGRLWEMMTNDLDLLKRLQKTAFLVLDEADRLFSKGHFKELAEILNALDRDMSLEIADNDGDTMSNLRKTRQTLVFSATFHRNLHQRLAGKNKQSSSNVMSQQESLEYLLTKVRFQEEKPKFIDSNPESQMVDKLTECILECSSVEKDLYLYALLLHHVKHRVLIFVNSISSVRRLTPFLQNLSLQANALHSQMPQKARLRAVERFSSVSAPSAILVATDVAARGLDIPSVQLVLHYHVPRAADVYIHRSGRTARAGSSGSSILLCAPEEAQGVKRLVAKVHAQTAVDFIEDSKKKFIQTIELDRRIVSRVKSRVALGKKIADASLAKEKHGHEDHWLKTAAEDLGVDYDSDEFAGVQGAQKGRGKAKNAKQKEARALSKDELAALRAQLRDELKTRVNVGVSELYLTAGGIDVDALLAEKEQGQFLGKIED